MVRSHPNRVTCYHASMNDASSDAAAGAHRPAHHPSVKCGRIGVLITNLGTPDATDYSSMRRYLKEFLSDKRVIEENSLVWKLSST